jgi:hypothetical protein
MRYLGHMSRCLVGAAAGLTLAASIASAAVVDIDSVVDPTPNQTITTSTAFSFSHTIAGFDVGIDAITDALLEIILSDSGASEGIRYNFEGTIINQNNTGNAATTYSFNLGTLNILSILSDGVLNVTLSATSGSYIFNSSHLTGHFSEPDPILIQDPVGELAVPEPAGIAILVGALTWLGARRRKV